MQAHLDSQLKAASESLKQGNLEELARLIGPLKQSYPGIGDVWALDAELAIRQGRIQDGLTAVNKAAELEPNLPARHVQRARCQILAGLEYEAEQSANEALAFDIIRVDHLLILAGVLVRCGDHEKALRLYIKGEKSDPNNPDVYRGIASVYRFLGDLEEAEGACEKVLALDAHDYETIGMRSSIRRQTRKANHIPELCNLLEQGVKGWRGAVHVAYALAKEYDDIGEFAKAFVILQNGAKFKRRHTKYDLEDDLKIFSELITAFSPQRVSEISGMGSSSAAPIFVLGIPRTGSTLIERIISSHSKVQNLGELSTFSAEMVRLVQEDYGERMVPRLELPSRASKLPMEALGASYLAKVDSLRDESPYFIDKLPLNSLNVGLIHAALPNSKIIHVKRNPMDACFAIYKYLFKHGYPFSYDLEELAAYYAKYHQLMTHWIDVLPSGRIYEISYEQVVADMPGQAKALIGHLGLDWEDSCEQFHENMQASTTGSASQVRQPIYSSSVERWRKYEKELIPLRRALESHGVSAQAK